MDNYATFQFSGSQVTLFYTAYTNRGKMDVYVDDVFVTQIDGYSAGRIWQKEWSSDDLGASTHTIKIVNAGPAGTIVDIDAIEIKDYAPPPTPGIGKYNDTASGWSYSSGWTTWSGSGPYNNDIHYSNTTGNTAEFTFEGSQLILVYTGYTNRGTVDVYVDDILEGTINQYSATRDLAGRMGKWRSGGRRTHGQVCACQWFNGGHRCDRGQDL